MNGTQVLRVRVAKYRHVISVERDTRGHVARGEPLEDPQGNGPLKERVQDVNDEHEEYE